MVLVGLPWMVRPTVTCGSALDSRYVQLPANCSTSPPTAPLIAPARAVALHGTLTVIGAASAGAVVPRPATASPPAAVAAIAPGLNVMRMHIPLRERRFV